MKFNILVIDDEEDIRNSIAGLLEDENYEVRTVENSDQALDAISERLPDLILIDIWLENSKLDGLELLNEIQSKFLSLPCVMISGHGNIDIAVKAIRSGASDYIEKPFEVERLLITLERVLEISKLKKSVFLIIGSVSLKLAFRSPKRTASKCMSSIILIAKGETK